MSLEIVKIEIGGRKWHEEVTSIRDYDSYTYNIYLEKKVYLEEWKDKLLFDTIRKEQDKERMYSCYREAWCEISDVSIDNFTISNSLDILSKTFTFDGVIGEDKKLLFEAIYRYGRNSAKILNSHNKIEKIFNSIMETGDSEYVDKSFSEYTDKEIAINNMVSLRIIANKL